MTDAAGAEPPMQLDGSLRNNLAAALRSARRLRDKPVHADTLAHWASLVRHARGVLGGRTSADVAEIDALVTALEAETAGR